MDYPFHPLADRYPLLDGDDFARFSADVAVRGLDKPIVLWRGQIIDGRNRYRACQEAEVEPTFVDRSEIPEGELDDWIATQNEHRRHLTAEYLAARRQERIVRVAEGRREGKSLHRLAEEHEVSVAQVRRDITEASATLPGGKVEPADGKVTGKDGKKRPAARRTTPTTVGPEQPRLFADDGEAGEADARPAPKQKAQTSPARPAEADRAESLAKSRVRLLAPQLRQLDTPEKRRIWLIQHARVMRREQQRLRYRSMLLDIRGAIDGLVKELDVADLEVQRRPRPE